MPGILPFKVIQVGSNNNANNRIAQACDRCRAKKIKCTGELPACGQCRSVGLDCRTSDKLSRKSFPRGYTESLEQRVRDLETEIQELKDLLDERDEKIELLSKLHDFTNPRNPPSFHTPLETSSSDPLAKGGNGRQLLPSTHKMPTGATSRDQEAQTNTGSKTRESSIGVGQACKKSHRLSESSICTPAKRTLNNQSADRVPRSQPSKSRRHTAHSLSYDEAISQLNLARAPCPMLSNSEYHSTVVLDTTVTGRPKNGTHDIDVAPCIAGPNNFGFLDPYTVARIMHDPHILDAGNPLSMLSVTPANRSNDVTGMAAAANGPESCLPHDPYGNASPLLANSPGGWQQPGLRMAPHMPGLSNSNATNGECPVVLDHRLSSNDLTTGTLAEAPDSGHVAGGDPPEV